MKMTMEELKKKLSRLFQMTKNIYHLTQAVVANIWYGFPSRKLKVIGVTGTDGKTTTTHLIYHILKEAGLKVSMISTVYAKIGDKEHDTGLHTTTPDPFLVQRMLKSALDHGDEYFVLETTSHAIDQNRVWGVKYEVGVLTNVTHEHLDYHRDFNDYLSTKLYLLRRSKICIVNRDDNCYGKVVSLINSDKKRDKVYLTYGLKNPSDYQFDLRKEIPQLAEFNAYNYLASYAVASRLGVSDGKIRKSLASFKLPPGRIDEVWKGDYSVIVDFAHTPNAIKRILQTVRKTYLRQNGKIIHVFGSAGLRDSSKRPLMGQASGQEADITILTEEDYRTEDPREICRQISAGLEKEGFNRSTSLHKTDSKKYDIIINRKDAIKFAMSLASKSDIVVITGKGHEKSLCRGKKEYPWDDRQAVLEALHT